VDAIQDIYNGISVSMNVMNRVLSLVTGKFYIQQSPGLSTMVLLNKIASYSMDPAQRIAQVESILRMHRLGMNDVKAMQVGQLISDLHHDFSGIFKISEY
jgi:hypothetical protein